MNGPRDKGKKDDSELAAESALRKSTVSDAHVLTPEEKEALKKHQKPFQDVLSEMLLKLHKDNQQLKQDVNIAYKALNTEQTHLGKTSTTAEKIAGVKPMSPDVVMNSYELRINQYNEAIAALKNAEKTLSIQEKDIQEALNQNTRRPGR